MIVKLATWKYSYDARGNRLTAVATGSRPSTQTLTYNAANQITNTGYTDDGAGNFTSNGQGSATYNGAEQVTQTQDSSGTVTNSTYAGASQTAVLSQDAPTGNTDDTTYGKADPQGNPEIVRYEVDNDYTEIGSIYSDPTTGQPIMLSLTNDSDALFVYDGQGNVLGVISDSSTVDFSYAYDPHGAQVLTSTDGGNAEEANSYS